MSKEFLVQEFRLLLELLDPGVFEHDVTENLTRLQDIIDDNGLTITEVMEKVTMEFTTNGRSFSPGEGLALFSRNVKLSRLRRTAAIS